MSEKKTDQSYRRRLELRLIDIAERLIETEGLDAVQARRVTKEADCSVGTLYNIFGDLDGLILAVNSKTLSMMFEQNAMIMRAASRGDLKDRLITLGLAYWDFAIKNEKRWRAVFAHRIPEGRDAPEHLTSLKGRHFNLVEQELLPIIPDEAERLMVARALFSAVHGIVTLSLDSTLVDLNAEEAERQIVFILTTAVRGLQKEGTSKTP